MKQVDEATASAREATELAPGGAQSVLSPEAWDRRERNPRLDRALACLDQAARHLVFDQMRADRSYLPGAWEAVEILWNAMLQVEAARVTRERVERLSAVWLPQQLRARTMGKGPATH